MEGELTAPGEGLVVEVSLEDMTAVERDDLLRVYADDLSEPQRAVLAKSDATYRLSATGERGREAMGALTQALMEDVPAVALDQETRRFFGRGDLDVLGPPGDTP
jgi:hypothetical protein